MKEDRYWSDEHTPALPALSAGSAVCLLSGIGLGATLMYFLDPRRGRYRRAVVKDKAVSLAHRSGTVAGKKLRHLRGEARGMVATAGQWLRGGAEGTSDQRLANRIRSKLGRLGITASDVDVDVRERCVTLRGEIDNERAEKAVSVVSRLKGVREVQDQLFRSGEPGTRRGERQEIGTAVGPV